MKYIKKTVSWRFWAFGWHDYRVTHDYRSRRILCIGIGPLRLHFLDTKSIEFDDSKYRKGKYVQ